MRGSRPNGASRAEWRRRPPNEDGSNLKSSCARSDPIGPSFQSASIYSAAEETD
jgi:hypothetical protein